MILGGFIFSLTQLWTSVGEFFSLWYEKLFKMWTTKVNQLIWLLIFGSKVIFYYMLNNILNIHNISYVFAGDSQNIISTVILQSFLNSLLASMKVPLKTLKKLHLTSVPKQTSLLVSLIHFCESIQTGIFHLVCKRILFFCNNTSNCVRIKSVKYVFLWRKYYFLI